MQIDTYVWLSINGIIYLYVMDDLEAWDYYYNKYGRNKGRFLSKIRSFCKGKVKKVGERYIF